MILTIKHYNHYTRRLTMIKKSILTFLSIGLLSITTLADNNNSDLNATDYNTSEVNLSTLSSAIEVHTDNCIGCHGENFEKPAMGISEIVKNMTKEYIEASLFNYKYESNDGNMNALMAWQTSQLSDDEIRALARKIGK